MFSQIGCQEKPKKNSIKVKVPEKTIKKVESKEEKEIYLDDKNAIPFFMNTPKNKENRVRIITKYGNIDVLLYDNTPYHRANFVYLTKQEIFRWYHVSPSSTQISSFKEEIRTVGKA